jgi:hypothetical protein
LLRIWDTPGTRLISEGIFDGPQHDLGLQQDLVVPEAQHPIPLLLEESTASLVVALLIQVLAAIDLDHEFLLQADEIDNVGTDDVLPTELVPEHLSATQIGPQMALGPGGIVSELSTVFEGFVFHPSEYNHSVACCFPGRQATEETTMAHILQPFLFTWKQIEGSSELERLALVLAALPDEKLIRTLEQARGKGRNDYPIRACWNALIAGIVFQHASAASLLRELRRNGQLRQLCGFDPLRGEDAVPTADAFGYFLELVVQHQKELEEMFDLLVARLAEWLPDFGRRLAVDSKAIHSYGKPVADEKKAGRPDRRRETDADWGVKTYKGVREDGTAWEKAVRWFGFKLHLIVDSHYELPVGFELTKASESDSTKLPGLLDELAERQPVVVERAEEMAADRGYDSAENNQKLYDEHGINPIIDTRRLWKKPEGEDQTRPLFAQRVDTVVYDERGQLYCVCPQTGERRELAYCGFEKDRESQKWRCPARAFGFECAGRASCEAHSQVGEYGRVVRVPLSLDRRIFTPVSRATQKWKKAYDRRTAVERVNSRIDRILSFEVHTIRGLSKMRMRVQLALCIMLAMALGRIEADQREKIRSLLTPAKQAA